MIHIQSIKNKDRERVVSLEEWELMKKEGLDHNWKVVCDSELKSEVVPIPPVVEEFITEKKKPVKRTVKKKTTKTENDGRKSD